MNTTFSSARWPLVAGAALVFPGLYLLMAGWLHHHLQIDLPWQLTTAFLSDAPEGHFGFHINMMIIIGPVIAILINLRKVIFLNTASDDETLYLQCSVSKYSFGWAIISAAVFCLAAFTIFTLGQNCNC